MGAPPPMGGPPMGAPPPMGGPPMGAPPPMSGPPGGGGGSNAVNAPTTPCPRCSAPTPAGFAFCQQCGFKMGAPAPGGGPPATGPAPDAHAMTLAATGPGPGGAPFNPLAPPPSNGSGPPMGGMGGPTGGMAHAPTPAVSASWGSVVSVNRDGSDGERYPLAGEYVIVGRNGADIVFDEDSFLARHHARLERTGDGVRVVPLDTLNGVFRRIDTPADLVDGSIMLLGREVLRFETVEGEEKTPEPLVRHGVALFGSPPREPWGRLLQMLPSGGIRDIRHLWDDEVTLGREEGDIVFSDDAFLSRRHANITWNGQRAQLTDLQSSNGTFVRLTGPLALRHGEYVRMGDQLFRVELRR
jgi:pSer/pThr/pTyr-binding forkhead associated (FHA) protein